MATIVYMSTISASILLNFYTVEVERIDKSNWMNEKYEFILLIIIMIETIYDDML